MEGWLTLLRQGEREASKMNLVKQIFISYAGKDREIAQRLANDLQREGFRVWIAPDTIHASEIWPEAIDKGLRESSHFMVLLSPAAMDSPWVNLETSAAIGLERLGETTIIPLLVEKCEMPALLGVYQYIPFHTYEEGWKLLLRILHTGERPGVEMAVFPIHVRSEGSFQAGSAVFTLAFSPDGSVLAAGTQDGTIVRWSMPNGQPVEPIQASRETVRSLTFSPDGRLLASGSADNELRLWSAMEGRLLDSATGHSDMVTVVAFSPDGARLVTGSKDNRLCLWEVRKGTAHLLRTLEGHTGSVYAAAFAPNGALIASGSSDRTVRLWAIDADEVSFVLGKITGTILCVAFSRDGTIVGTGSWGGSIRLWDVMQRQSKGILEGHNDRVYALAFSPQTELLASGSKDRSVRLWTYPAGEQAFSALRAHTGWVRSLDFSPDGRLLATGGTDGTIHLWRIRAVLDTREESPVASGRN